MDVGVTACLLSGMSMDSVAGSDCVLRSLVMGSRMWIG